MRVLVTGAGGFIGSEIVGQLVASRHDVVALARPTASLARLARWADKISTVAVDLDEFGAVQSCLGSARPEAVIHLAWYANPRDYLVSNANLASLTATTRFVEAALSAGCRQLVLAGTCVEYAPQDRLLVEEDPARPSTLYGSCKYAASLVSEALAAAAEARLCRARIFHLHGPGEDGGRLIPWVARELRAGHEVELTAGAQVRDQLHVEDVAAGLITLLRPSASGIYNISSGEPVTLRQVLETVGDILGRTNLLRFGARPYRTGETMFLAGDSRRLRSLGWAPRFGLRDGLKDALEQSNR